MKAVRSITLPRRVLIGHDVLDEVGTVCGELDLGGSLVVAYDKGTLKAAGAKVLDVLRNDGFTVTAFEVTEGGPPDVDALQNTARDHGAIVAVGGGRVIDVSKAAGFMAAIPFVSSPTAASHDGIASAQASLIEEGQRHSIAAVPPVAIVADTAVIAKAPPRLYRAGCGDIISNFTAVLDWQLARRLHNEYYGEYAANLALMSATMLMENADIVATTNEEGLSIVLEALISNSVAMSISGSSRPCSGGEHLFSHALDSFAKRPALHGEQVALGTIICTYLHGEDWETVRDALACIGAPVTAKEAGLTDKEIVKALLMAPKLRKRFTILHTGITEKAARRAAEATGVIAGGGR